MTIPFRSVDEVAAGVAHVAERLADGAIFACPTETVYGLGCALHSVALGRRAAAKKRDFKPFLLLDNDPPALEGLRWSAAARRLALAKQALLRRLGFGLLGGFQRAAGRGEQARPVGLQRVERAGAHQRLDHAAVHQALVDARAEVE
jgi:hypothetical protein